MQGMKMNFDTLKWFSLLLVAGSLVTKLNLCVLLYQNIFTYTKMLLYPNVICMFPVHVNQSTLLLRQTATHLPLLNLIGFKKLPQEFPFISDLHTKP